VIVTAYLLSQPHQFSCR